MGNKLIVNPVFQVGFTESGEIQYAVNGAFIYMTDEEMKNIRSAIIEAIAAMEDFRPKKPQFPPPNQQP